MNQSIANSAFSIPQSVVSFSSAYAPSSYVPPSRTPSRPGTARSRSSSVPDLPSAFPPGVSPGGQLPEVDGSGVVLGLGSSGNALRERPRTSIRESFAAPPPKPAYPRHSFARTRNSSAISGSGTSPFTSLRDSKHSRPKSTALNLHGDHGEGKEIDVIDKPWLEKRDLRVRTSWWLTFCLMFLGIAASGVRVYFGRKEVPLMSGNLCLVMDDEFDKGTIDQSIWGHEVDMGGFGNGEFEMTTASTNNSFVQDGILYITPTLTRDVIGSAAIFDGHTFNLTGCTNTNLTACGAVSNVTTRTVINPVQSARINTRNSTSIQYGRVEIRARMPRGDWLWPAIWMLPVDNSYGPWPLSGEMDIVEARGNGLDYPKQGTNYVRASLNWGPLSWLNEVSKTFGFWFDRRKGYDEEFHTYALEWTSDFVRMYVDSRLNRMYDLRFTEPFFNRGNFPPTVFNGTQEIPIPNPWLGASNAAPFDKPFYLIMNVAVGGTNGWFPDGAGDKPWLDGSTNAMYDFANTTDTWYATWPTDLTRRSLAVDYVKMWKQC
ncbi:concanavalin A-like lectin/glucanase [Rickenella mellea]|uniref:Concanavalin A-like lectin/glucanase n=1 Tax=Rickenella mellea TaxID=50990 RepID=A0A4Y7Q9H5_9AGAM|nr:concanavalin A-like lectin/glucanase [Rickenella mellea]